MRIDLNPAAAQPLPENGKSGSPGAAGSEARPGASSLFGEDFGEDQAQLSGSHTQIQALAARVSELAETRQEKVDALRQAVGEGSYRPTADAVAGAVFGHMVELPAA